MTVEENWEKLLNGFGNFSWLIIFSLEINSGCGILLLFLKSNRIILQPV